RRGPATSRGLPPRTLRSGRSPPTARTPASERRRAPMCLTVRVRPARRRWLIVLALFVVTYGISTPLAAYGVFLPVLAETFGWSRGALATALSINLMVGGLAAGQPVDVGAQPRGEERVTIGQDHHRRPELHPSGRAREPPQGDERIVERRRIAGDDVGGHRDVIGDHDEVIAEGLRELRPARERVRAHARPEVEEVHADPHRDRRVLRRRTGVIPALRLLGDYRVQEGATAPPGRDARWG